MNKKNDAVIVAYGRTPLARAFKGGFSMTHPIHYTAEVLKGVLEKVPQLDTSTIEDIIVGNAIPERYTGYNIARLVAQKAGLPDVVPAQTINRFCSSGLQAIATATNAIEAEQMEIVVAGGVEMMTGLNMGHPEEFHDQELAKMIPGTYMSMGETAEQVAKNYNISRKEMEIMAVKSHQKAHAAQGAGHFDNEIIPITIKNDEGQITLTKDEGIRPSTNAAKLSELKPCFREDGLVTAATSSQMTDGASFVVLMSRKKAQELGCAPIARYASFAVVGVAAEVMGIGPVAAVPKALEKAGITVDDLDVIELNEAFAAQAIACIKELNLPMDKINPNGGAMALGHPMGATGAVLTCKAISHLKRTNGKYALITMCIGGGMGAAGVLVMEKSK